MIKRHQRLHSIAQYVHMTVNASGPRSFMRSRVPNGLCVCDSVCAISSVASGGSNDIKSIG